MNLVLYNNSKYLFTRTKVVSKFLSYTAQCRKERRTEYPFLHSTHELLRMGDEALQKINMVPLLLLPEYERNVQLCKHKEHLSMILYQFYQRRETDNLLHLFNTVQSRNALNESSYTILMRYYSDIDNLNMVRTLFLKLQENHKSEIDTRSFVPLIVLLLKHSEFDEALIYMTQMCEYTKMKFNDIQFALIIRTCAEIRDQRNNDVLTHFIEVIFDTLHTYGVGKIQSECVDAIKEWFNRDPICLWSITKSEITKHSRECQSCQQRLEPVYLSEEQKMKLKESLVSIIEESLSIMVIPKSQHRKTMVQNSADGVVSRGEKPGEVELLKSHLASHGPFDVVIDSLNMGYKSQHGFEINKVQAVANYFLHQKKRILIICAGRMNESHWLKIKPGDKPAFVRFRKIMTQLNNSCSLYHSVNSYVDDYCLLYTVAHHDFKIKLISSDLLRDHFHLLSPENRTAFQKWQLANQIKLSHFTYNDYPIFQPVAKYNIALQRNNGVWHIPVSLDLVSRKTEASWLCIRQTGLKNIE